MPWELDMESQEAASVLGRFVGIPDLGVGEAAALSADQIHAVLEATTRPDGSVFLCMEPSVMVLFIVGPFFVYAMMGERKARTRTQWIATFTFWPHSLAIFLCLVGLSSSTEWASLVLYSWPARGPFYESVEGRKETVPCALQVAMLCWTRRCSAMQTRSPARILAAMCTSAASWSFPTFARTTAATAASGSISQASGGARLFRHCLGHQLDSGPAVAQLPFIFYP
jgi:hypothetical protein